VATRYSLLAQRTAESPLSLSAICQCIVSPLSASAAYSEPPMPGIGSRSSKSNPITCSGAASARVLLVRAHLLVAYCNQSMAWVRAREARNPAVKKAISTVQLARYQQLSLAGKRRGHKIALSEHAPSIDSARSIWLSLIRTFRFR
jgi:hypothetical protein